jgi:HAD superfamily hydrolase (TIGR01509 family)
MLKAVLFDVDGTLAETEEFHRGAFNAVFAAHGLEHTWSVEQYRELLKVTGGKERMTAYFAAQAVEMPEARIRELHLAKNAGYAQGIASGNVRLRPGVLRLMREIQSAGLRLGIATTTSQVNLDALLRPLLGPAWAAQYACVVAGDQVVHKKPAPDVYQACLLRLGISAGEALAIEDSAAGVRSARAAGIAVLATPSCYTDRDDLSGADACVPNLGEPDLPWDRPIGGFPAGHVRCLDLQRLVAERGSAGIAAHGARFTGENFTSH